MPVDKGKWQKIFDALVTKLAQSIVSDDFMVEMQKLFALKRKVVLGLRKILPPGKVTKEQVQQALRSTRVKPFELSPLEQNLVLLSQAMQGKVPEYNAKLIEKTLRNLDTQLSYLERKARQLERLKSKGVISDVDLADIIIKLSNGLSEAVQKDIDIWQLKLELKFGQYNVFHTLFKEQRSALKNKNYYQFLIFYHYENRLRIDLERLSYEIIRQQQPRVRPMPIRSRWKPLLVGLAIVVSSLLSACGSIVKPMPSPMANRPVKQKVIDVEEEKLKEPDPELLKKLAPSQMPEPVKKPESKKYSKEVIAYQKYIEKKSGRSIDIDIVVDLMKYKIPDWYVAKWYKKGLTINEIYFSHTQDYSDGVIMYLHKLGDICTAHWGEEVGQQSLLIYTEKFRRPFMGTSLIDLWHYHIRGISPEVLFSMLHKKIDVDIVKYLDPVPLEDIKTMCDHGLSLDDMIYYQGIIKNKTSSADDKQKIKKLMVEMGLNKEDVEKLKQKKDPAFLHALEEMGVNFTHPLNREKMPAMTKGGKRVYVDFDVDYYLKMLKGYWDMDPDATKKHIEQYVQNKITPIALISHGLRAQRSYQVPFQAFKYMTKDVQSIFELEQKYLWYYNQGFTDVNEFIAFSKQLYKKFNVTWISRLTKTDWEKLLNQESPKGKKLAVIYTPRADRLGSFSGASTQQLFHQLLVAGDYYIIYREISKDTQMFDNIKKLVKKFLK